jgi:hypothetical protein
MSTLHPFPSFRALARALAVLGACALGACDDRSDDQGASRGGAGPNGSPDGSATSPTGGGLGQPSGGAPGNGPGGFDAQLGGATTPQSFESELPAGGSAAGSGLIGGLAGGTGGGGLLGGLSATPGTATDAAGGEAAERAIVEADIVQIAGDRLYALSRSAGLSIIDIGNPAQLRVLGQQRALSGTHRARAGDVRAALRPGARQLALALRIPADSGRPERPARAHREHPGTAAAR